jgi:hypothetical protein
MEDSMTIHREGYRWSEPGKLKSATCNVCGAACHIYRNVLGPTSCAAAVAGLQHLHDHICCPNAGLDWHNQALALKREAESTPSPTLGAILRSGLGRLVSSSIAAMG